MALTINFTRNTPPNFNQKSTLALNLELETNGWGLDCLLGPYDH